MIISVGICGYNICHIRMAVEEIKNANRDGSSNMYTDHLIKATQSG